MTTLSIFYENRYKKALILRIMIVIITDLLESWGLLSYTDIDYHVFSDGSKHVLSLDIRCIFLRNPIIVPVSFDALFVLMYRSYNATITLICNNTKRFVPISLTIPYGHIFIRSF